MDYRKIYVSIVLRAQAEDAERRRNKREHGAYYEKHHIIPKSLGGTNGNSNLAMLTAREHFICHWLLVKIYKPGTEQRKKMLNALWRMRSDSATHYGNRYINARAYESLRIEFARMMGTRNAVLQAGERNSMYGNRWYTNSITGETVCSSIPLDYPWYRGRSLFTGEFNHLSYDSDCKSICRKRMLKPNMSHKTKPNKDVFRSAEQYRDSQIMESVNATRRLWEVNCKQNFS